MLYALVVAMILSGCVTDPRDIGREPHMSAIGSGLQAEVEPNANFPPAAVAGGQSLWDNNRADLFRDPRATRVGDVVTVMISIDDKATLGNSSGRSQNAAINGNLDYAWGANATKTTGVGDLNSSSASSGQGTIDRSEKIQVAVGAVVTQILPNGNLVISGSQEVRVNFELRQVNVAGIVRPRDISKNNTIAYDKIAEARVSYGGRGRITEVQQPQWGQQIYDWLRPF